MPLQWADMTPEQKARKRDRAREARAQKWANMLPEAREAKRAAQREVRRATSTYVPRALLSPDELAAHRAYNNAAQNARRARLTEEEREATRAYQRAYNAALRLTVLKYYGGDPPSCACCGERQIKFLSIDHINGGGIRHRREISGKSEAAGGATLIKWLKRNGYPEGFRVLCFNCNQAAGHYGACPHEEERVVPIMRGKDALN